MKFQWYEALPDWAQDVVDQIGHMGIGGIPAAVVGGLCTIALEPILAGSLGMAAGIVSMGVYELIQNVGDATNDYLDLAIDLAVGMGTAVAVGVLIWCVA